jgi:Translation elongation factors (GTPases)
MADDELMEKYFNGDDFTDEEIKNGLVKGISDGVIVPVCSSAFQLGHGIEGLLDLLLAYVPTPLQHGPYAGFNDNNEPVERLCVTDAPMSAFVFKTIVDPFVGKISIMKVVTGKINSGSEVLNERTRKSEKLGKLFFLRGKEQLELNYAEAGDIVAVAKLQYTLSGDTLCDKSDIIRYLPLDFPSPTYYIAIEAADKGDEDKMGTGLNRLREEDPSFVVERNAETHQTLLGGQGDIQLNIVIAKLKDRFGVTVNTVPQKIAYRETIKGNSDVQGKHKKQSGGAGQYGDVHIRFSPSKQDGLEFSEELFGGSVPKNYVPAVEKGLQECMDKGPLAGCKVVNVKAVLYDGSYHEVDSNEVSFKIAASLAFKKGIVEAKPCLLEPIMHLEIYVPDDYMGDVMGDMNKRRGKILGMEPQTNGGQKLLAEAPQAELFDYSLGLRSMTQGRGTFEMKFDRYEEVPKMLADKIIAQHQAEQEA